MNRIFDWRNEKEINKFHGSGSRLVIQLMNPDIQIFIINKLFGESSKMNKTRNKGQEHEGNDFLQDDLAEVPEDYSPSKTK